MRGLLWQVPGFEIARLFLRLDLLALCVRENVFTEELSVRITKDFGQVSRSARLSVRLMYDRELACLNDALRLMAFIHPSANAGSRVLIAAEC